MQFLQSYEFKEKEEEKLETFKQALVQAFPSQYSKIYPPQNDSIPDGIEQRAPESEEEMDEFEKIMSILSQGQKSMSLDQLIEEIEE
jgi:hypothetical protein